MSRLRIETDFQFRERTIRNSGERPYDVYVALVTQSSSLAPVATVLENTFSSDFVWTRASAGTYNVALSGSFPTNGTFCTATVHSLTTGNERACTFGQVSNHACRLKIYTTGSFTLTDNFYNPVQVEIRSYNV